MSVQLKLNSHLADNATFLLHIPRDRIIRDMLSYLGISHQVAFYQGGLYSADFLINTCRTPPLHAQLFTHGRAMLTQPLKPISPGSASHRKYVPPGPESHRKRKVILLTRAGSRNPGRNVVNFKEVADFLARRYGNDLHIFNGGYSLSDSIELFS